MYVCVNNINVKNHNLGVCLNQKLLSNQDSTTNLTVTCESVYDMCVPVSDTTFAVNRYKYTITCITK